jgi:hypothetical protein
MLSYFIAAFLYAVGFFLFNHLYKIEKEGRQIHFTDEKFAFKTWMVILLIFLFLFKGINIVTGLLVIIIWFLIAIHPNLNYKAKGEQFNWINNC